MQMNHPRTLIRILLASLITTLLIWAVWFALTPVAPRIALNSLMIWGVFGTLGMTAVLYPLVYLLRTRSRSAVATIAASGLACMLLGVLLALTGNPLPLSAYWLGLAGMTAASLFCWLPGTGTAAVRA